MTVLIAYEARSGDERARTKKIPLLRFLFSDAYANALPRPERCAIVRTMVHLYHYYFFSTVTTEAAKRV